LIFRALKRLESAISLSVVHWFMGKHGWTFDEGPGVIPDPILGARRLYEVYLRSDPTYTGRVTVPVLWDKRGNVIVSNESSEIIRMLNSAFDAVGAAPGDFHPIDLREMIDGFNARIYATSTTAFTEPDLQRPRQRMRRRYDCYSRHWICWRNGSRYIDTFAGNA
jgi:putative glutathione S-transferase